MGNSIKRRTFSESDCDLKKLEFKSDNFQKKKFSSFGKKLRKTKNQLSLGDLELIINRKKELLNMEKNKSEDFLKIISSILNSKNKNEKKFEKKNSSSKLNKEFIQVNIFNFNFIFLYF